MKKTKRSSSLQVDTSVQRQLRSHSSQLSSSPRIISNTINNQAHGQEDASLLAMERVLEDLLISMNRLIFKSKAMETHHDLLTIQDQINIRSHELYTDDLANSYAKFEKIQGPSSRNTKISALTQLGGKYLQDIERLIFTSTRQELESKTADLHALREFSQANDIKLRHEIASKDQAITRLTLENERLKNEKMELERNYITMQKEFDGAILRNAQVNQQMVEFRLRGLDLKSEVNRRAKKVLKSVESRLGFVPQDVVRNISYLTILKAPGDPEYDKVRVLSLAQAQSKKFDESKKESKSIRKSIDKAIDVAFENQKSEGLGSNSTNSSPQNRNIAWASSRNSDSDFNRLQDLLDENFDDAEVLHQDDDYNSDYNA